MHVRERLQRDVRIDRARAIADQRGEMRDFARLAAFDDDAALRPLALAHEVVVQAGGREQGRDRRHVLRCAAVGKD